MRSFLTALFRFFVGIFYRRIEMEGLEHVPANGAVVFAVNHPNGLIDPLFLICFAPRPVSFLAKAPLFHYPVIGAVTRAFDCIPVYRKQDNTTGTNKETFARARDVLSRGGAIAIFPEGTTHSDPQLHELKTGAARIAIGASLPGLVVIPAGIYYTAKQTFRSSVLLVIGAPLDPPTAAVDENGEPERAAVEQLTDAIDEGLDRITLQADSRSALELIARAEDIVTSREEQPLAEELELRRRFVDGYRRLAKLAPARLAHLESRITRFESQVREAGLSVDELATPFSKSKLLFALVLLPLGFAGAVLHYPTYRLIGWMAARLSKEEVEVNATMKFLSALLLLPLTWLALAVAGWWWRGWTVFFAVLFLAPVLGYIALRVSEQMDDAAGWIRVRLNRDLVAQRNAIRAEIIQVATEFDA